MEKVVAKNLIPVDALVYCGHCGKRMELVERYWATPYYRCTPECEERHPVLCGGCDEPLERDQFGQLLCTSNPLEFDDDCFDDDVPY